MKQRIFFGALFGLPIMLVGVYVLTSVAPDVMPLPKETQTLSMLNSIADIAACYESVVTNHELMAQIKSELVVAPDRALGRYLLEYSLRAPYVLQWLVAIDESDHVVVDRWGNPIVVEAFCLNNRRNILANVPYFRLGNQWVRIWSCGPNAKDDNGFKDDLRVCVSHNILRSFFLYDYEMPVKVLDIAEVTSLEHLRNSIHAICCGEVRSFGLRSRNRQVNFSCSTMWPDIRDYTNIRRYRIKVERGSVEIEEESSINDGMYMHITKEDFLGKVNGMDVVEVVIGNSADIGTVDNLLTLLLASGSRHLTCGL